MLAWDFLYWMEAMAALELTFDDVADLFVELGSVVSPSELHGLLVGQLSTGKRFSQSQWLSEACDILEVEQPSDAVLQKELFEFYEQTLVQLEDENMSFGLLLPDDEGTDFNEILAMVSAWCGGFLVGLALAGKKEFDEETTEVLQDFAEISQLVDEDEVDEESQHALFDIVEYVRVASLSLFLESGAKPAQPIPGSPVLH